MLYGEENQRFCNARRRVVGRKVKGEKSKATQLDTLLGLCVMCICVGVWSVDGGWKPLPNRPQRYCEPASLVVKPFPCEKLNMIRKIPFGLKNVGKFITRKRV